MRHFILIFGLLGIVSARADFCENYEKAVKISAYITAEAFQCSNTEEIYRDQLEFYHYSEFCSKGFVCNVISNAISNYLMTRIPEKYDCKPTRAHKVTKNILYLLCTAYTPKGS